MTSSTTPWISSRTRSSRESSSTPPGIPCSAAHLPISSGSSVISAATYGFRSPTTTACETYFEFLRSFSRFCGATFLPPAVTMMSFFRSVIVMKPSSSIVAMSPGSEPAVLAEHRRRRLGILVVALEDRLAPDEQLPVLGELHLEARQRLADGAEAEGALRVRRRRGRALGQPVALDEQDVDRVEELGDLGRERGAARDGRVQAAAEALLDLGVDEPVGERGTARPARAGRAARHGAARSRRARREAPSRPASGGGRWPRRSARRRRCGSSRRRAARSGRRSGARPAGRRRP